MRTVLIGCILLLTMVGCGPNIPFVTNRNHTRKFPKIQNPNPKSIFRLEWRDGPIVSHGTAFATTIHNKLYILSAYHVVEGEGNPIFLTDKRNLVPVHVLRTIKMPSIDVVAFEILRDPDFIKPLDNSNVMPTDQINAMGFPFAKDMRLARGKVRKIIIDSDCDIEVGMSGGPILNNDSVVGLTTSKQIPPGGVHVPMNVISETLTNERYEKIWKGE